MDSSALTIADGKGSVVRASLNTALALMGGFMPTIQRSTAYSVGDVGYYFGLSTNCYMECVTAGTTSSSVPTTPTIVGSLTADGGAVFALRNILNNSLANNVLRSTAYSVGDVVFGGNSSPYYLECVTAGTTSSSVITVTTTAGTLITDSGVTWIVCDMRDPLPVGEVIPFFTRLHTGYVKANGATVTRASYPRLFTYATNNSLFYDDGTRVFTGAATSGATSITGISTTDIAALTALGILPIYITGTGIASGTTITAIGTTSVTISNATTAAISAGAISYGNISNFPTLYGVGDGSTTMVLPNAIGRIPQPSSVATGGRIDAGLPNITGSITPTKYKDSDRILMQDASGCLYTTQNWGVNDTGGTNTDQQPSGIGFDASKSDSIYGNSATVQQSAYATIPQIKY